MKQKGFYKSNRTTHFPMTIYFLRAGASFITRLLMRSEPLEVIHSS